MTATSAVVVNWNGADQLPACLDALLAQTHPDLEVVVVDNASTDASPAVLSAYEERGVKVLRNATNRGFAGGANDGIAATSGEAVLLANFDVVPEPTYLARAVEALEMDPRTGAVQGKLLRSRPAPGGAAVIDTTGHVAFRTRLFRNRGEGEIDRGQWDRPDEVFGVSGALALYRREMLEDVAVPVPGGDAEIFDRDLFAYWEDVDLDWRAAMRGWTCRYEPRAVATHERGGAGPRRTARVEQLNWQNRLLTLVKCDTVAAAGRAAGGIALTTALKTAELGVTVPSALAHGLAAMPSLTRRMLRKRRTVQRRAIVPSEEVVARWFGPFDYAEWARTWWRRVRGVPAGA